jgi:hypothetical protein
MGGGGTPDTQPPTADGDGGGGEADQSELEASTDNVGVMGYRVERCQGAGCTNFDPIGASSGPSFSNTGLSADPRYRFRVRAVDAAENSSPYSNVAAAKTKT